MVEQKPQAIHQVKFVVDTNIVFSGILNSSSKIGKLLISSNPHFTFYSCDFLRDELLKHRDKLLKRTKLSEAELEELEVLVTSNITFINEGLIPQKIISSSEDLLKDIDITDTPHLALARFLKAKLWTGDKELTDGLRAKGYNGIITTDELAKLFDKLERN
jgi:predicted nucleic acid-binding protein